MPDIFGIGKIAEAGVEAGKAVYGAIEAKKGREEMYDAIDKIKYSRPEEYGQIMSLLGQRRSSVGTRADSMEKKIRSETAGSVSTIRQMADSPEAALTALQGVKGREMKAINDLEIWREQVSDEALMGHIKGLEMGAGYTEKEDYYNDMYKNMLHANIGANRMGAGTNMLWGGVEGVTSTALDYAGTKYLQDTYNGQNTQQPSSSPYGEGYDPTINWG